MPSIILKKLDDPLLSFAFIPEYKKSFMALAQMTMDETWGTPENPHAILKNYVRHTFRRLKFLYDAEGDDKSKWIYISDEDGIACFNTGLYTKNYNLIYAYFEKNTIPNRQAWMLKNYVDESSVSLSTVKQLPRRAKYIERIEDLLYNTDCKLRIDLDHILNDDENKRRIPEEYRDLPYIRKLFDGAIEEARKRIDANYNVAVPQFYNGDIQLLVPVSLSGDPTKTDLALAVKRDGNVYTGKTCLTVEMAYNNARLIVKPEVHWLRK